MNNTILKSQRNEVINTHNANNEFQKTKQQKNKMKRKKKLTQLKQ